MDQEKIVYYASDIEDEASDIETYILRLLTYIRSDNIDKYDRVIENAQKILDNTKEIQRLVSKLTDQLDVQSIEIEEDKAEEKGLSCLNCAHYNSFYNDCENAMILDADHCIMYDDEEENNDEKDIESKDLPNKICKICINLEHETAKYVDCKEFGRGFNQAIEQCSKFKLKI